MAKNDIQPYSTRQDKDLEMSEQPPTYGVPEYQPGSMPEIFQLIDVVSKKLTQIQRETIQEANLTPPQYFVLTLLWAGDGRPLKELAAASHCSRATMTGIVDTLESKELVVRQPNPDDRRSLLVKLTASGQSLRESTPTVDRIFRGCCTGLEPAEAHELSRLLKKLNDTLE
jgi:DNA-binding MarR family transcriptional regulator